MNMDKALILAHMDVINTCHFILQDSPELRKFIENYACSVCFEKDTCKIKGRCKATDNTINQLNTLTTLVTLHDNGAPEFGLLEKDRIFTLDLMLKPINPVLADYLSEGENLKIHLAICLANMKDRTLT